MAQNYRLFFSSLSALALTQLAQPVEAEVACVAEVYYSWVREQSALADRVAVATNPTSSAGASGAMGSTKVNSAGEPPSSAASSSSAGAVSSDSATPQVGLPGQQRVRFVQVERRGADERAVRAGLQIEVNRQKARAHERCKRDHESFGECVSTKLSIKGATLNSLSFSARSKVEEALIDECRIQQGRCLSIDSDEPTCRNLVAGAGNSGGASGVLKAEEEDAKSPPKEAAKPTKQAATADKPKPAKKKP